MTGHQDFMSTGLGWGALCRNDLKRVAVGESGRTTTPAGIVVVTIESPFIVAMAVEMNG